MKKLLLDENLPKKLAKHFSDEFEVLTVSDLGWQSKTNGELLSELDKVGIQYLITADKNLRFQQNVNKYSVKVVVLETPDTRLKYLLNHIVSIENAINEMGALELLNVIDLSSEK